MKKIICVLMLALVGVVAHAQAALAADTTKTDSASAVTDTALRIDWNIMNSVYSPSQNELLSGEQRTATSEMSDRKPVVQNWMVLFILFAAGTVASVVLYVYKNDISLMWRSFIHQNLAYQIYRDRNLENGLRLSILYIVFFLSLSYLLNSYLNKNSEVALVPVFQLTAAMLVYVVAYVYVLRSVSRLYSLQQYVGFYLFTMNNVNQLSALMLLPACLIVFALGANYSAVFGFLILSVVLLAQLIRWLLGMRFAWPYIAKNKFHFFLYFCCVEVAPLAIFYKLITKLLTY